MLRAHHAMKAFIPCIFAGLMACSADDTSADLAPVAEAEQAAVRGTLSVHGTFRDDVSAGGVAMLALKTDGSFHMEDAVVCVRYPCELPETNGRYSFVADGQSTALVLKSESGIVLNKFHVLLKGDSLYLRTAGTQSAWQELQRSDQPWCEAPRDCLLQALPHGDCMGSWSCETEVCSYHCGMRGSEPPVDTSEDTDIQ